jgi:hypothetical protein
MTAYHAPARWNIHKGGAMPRFRVRDLMINVGEGSNGICEIITNCGGVTELCVEDTQGLRVQRSELRVYVHGVFRVHSLLWVHGM